MRLQKHPILSFERGNKVTFTFEGKEYEGYEGESIAAALAANNIHVLREHAGRKRGLFCAIGNCSSCLMTVNGKNNVRVCVEALQADMNIVRQPDKGSIFGGVEQ